MEQIVKIYDFAKDLTLTNFIGVLFLCLILATAAAVLRGSVQEISAKLSRHSVYEQVVRRKLGQDPFRHGRFTIIVDRGFMAFIKRNNGTLY